MKCYSAAKRKAVPIHATPWMTLKNVIPTERSQTQEAICCMILLTQNVPNRQIHETGSRSVVAGVRERRALGMAANCTRVLEECWRSSGQGAGLFLSLQVKQKEEL